MTALELRAALERLGLRQGAFAVLLGVHRVTVTRWATGELAVPRYAAAYLELAEKISLYKIHGAAALETFCH